MTRLRFVLLACAGLVLACEGPLPGAPPHDRDPPIDGIDAGTFAGCVRPAEGCPCPAGTEPLDCHPEPEVGPNGERVCRPGARFCREGTWTACLAPGDVPSDDPGAASAALISPPTTCNPCDPLCFVTTDAPTVPGDVNPGNSSGVELVPGGGGVRLPESGVFMGPGDSDGDGVPDDFDTFPMDPTRDGFTEEGGIFHLLPEGATAGPDPVSISTRIKTADIYVLMDATGSMAGEIANLRDSLTTSLEHAARAATGNERQANAFDLGTDPASGVHRVNGNTSAMVNDVAPTCAAAAAARDAVFRFTLTKTTSVTISTVGLASWNTVLELRDGAFASVACNDDTGGSQSTISLPNLAAGTYYVVLDGASSTARGTYGVTFDFVEPGCGPGLLGTIRCIIPDAWFGVGYFREYPISPWGYGTNPVYRHALDITGDLGAVSTAVNALRTDGNMDWPESLTQALHATVTGRGLGTDWVARPGNGFAACPAGRWGWPCFREGTIPIVIGFTDAPPHEGPDPQFDYAHDDRWTTTTAAVGGATGDLGTTSGVGGNETQANALNLNDVTAWIETGFKTFTGSTRNAVSDISRTITGCNDESESRDVTFRFTLTARRDVTLSMAFPGSTTDYDAILSLHRTSITAANRVTCNDDAPGVNRGGAAITATLDPGTYYVVVEGFDAARGNYSLRFGRPTYLIDVQATAHDIGNVSPWIATSVRKAFTAATDPLLDDYDTATVGCGGEGRDAVFRFSLTASARVQIDTLGSDFDTTLALFSGSVSAGTRLACSNDAWIGGGASMITRTLPAGTYYVVIDGYDDEYGDLVLHVNGREPARASSNQAPAYWYQTRAAMLSTGTRFIGVRSCDPTASGDEGNFCDETLSDLQQIGVATESVDGGGAPYVTTIANDGSGLGASVADAVRSLANYTRFDITARATNDPATAFDERNFVQSIAVTSCPAARCNGPRTGALCGACTPGTDVGFDVVFRNTGVAPTGVPRTGVAQVFDFAIELVADGTSVLDSVPVRIVVPPIRPLYPETGSYWRDYDSTITCADNERPDWGTLEWDATLPAGTSIDFEVRGANTLGELPTATPVVRITTPPTASPRDVAPLLLGAGYSTGVRMLRVTAVLRADATRSATPTLGRMALRYSCLPSE